MELNNKVIVITGGTKGLGKELASFCAQKNALVVICSSNDPVKIENESFTYLKADVTKEQDIKDLIKTIVDKFGKIDIWINNAGVWLPHNNVENLDIDRVRKMIDINIIGTIIGSKQALIQMRKQSFGTIINILSTSALVGRATGSAYCASKFGVDGFTKSLRMEVAESDIKAIAAYPGGMKTNFFDEAKPENYDSYMEPSYVAEKIISNLELDQPEEELIIRRPTN